MYKNCIKRVIDFILSLCGLIVLSPIFIILCLWIKLDSKGPIFFKQRELERIRHISIYLNLEQCI